MAAEFLHATEPLLLRGLVADWPAVQAARRSDRAFCEFLRGHGETTPVGLWRGAPAIGGRFFYNADFSGFNFAREVQPFGRLLDELLATAGQHEAPALYLGSTELDASFPGLRSLHPLPALDAQAPTVNLWLGNRIRVPAHFDAADNLACVVAGRRRFTLFPPAQVANLYIGPLDLTPAGQPVSLVDVAAPDTVRFPRYAQALAHARLFELAAGDALFIPGGWWHAVDGLDDVNGLVNFWWRSVPAWMDTPMSALMLALLTLRELPPAQREAWRALFEHYVFEAEPDVTAAHIPERARGLLGPLGETQARQLRAWLLNRLNR